MVCSGHYQHQVGGLPEPGPARARREGSSLALKICLQIRRKQWVRTARGGPAAVKSEAEQRLQLNQFRDKNSACRPCLCSDFIKAPAALRDSQHVCAYLLLKTVKGAITATTTRAETLLSGVSSLFLSLFLLPTLSQSSQKCLFPHLFFSLMGSLKTGTKRWVLQRLEETGIPDIH